jgi:hypothetical protein
MTAVDEVPTALGTVPPCCSGRGPGPRREDAEPNGTAGGYRRIARRSSPRPYDVHSTAAAAIVVPLHRIRAAEDRRGPECRSRLQQHAREQSCAC